MGDLRGKRSLVTQAEIARRETLERVRAIDKVLRGMDSDSVHEFDEGVFGMLVERVMVMNLVRWSLYCELGLGS